MLFAALKDDLLGYYKRRIVMIFILIVIFASILFARLFILQVIEYEQLSVDANRNRITNRDIVAERGFIYDSKMNLLVSNAPTYDLVLNKEDIRRGDDVLGMLARVKEIVDFDMKAVEKALYDRRVSSILINRGLKISDIAYFEEYADNFIGLSVELHSVRKYADGLAFSHILGYVSEATPEDIERNRDIYKRGSNIGTMGIELQYEEELRGRAGSMEIERDARGRIVDVLHEDPAIAGNDLVLTIDADLQKYIADIMVGKKGGIVVLDIKDNSLLTLYSAPSYDLNMFTPYLNETEWAKIHKDKKSPLVNRPIEGQYSPGSVFKVVMALAGFEEKAVDTKTTYKCLGTFHLNSYFSYRCWKRTGHGSVNMQEALAQSCDIYFYNLGLALDIDKIEYYSKMFSLGELTGIDLPNEKTGVFPSRQWKKVARGDIWYPGDTVNTSIGQGYMTSTPLQIGVMMSGVFNGGKIYKPRIVKGIIEQETGEYIEKEPELKHQIEVTKEIQDNIMAGLIDAVYKKGGTSRRATVREMKIGGKTGTAQVVSAKVTEKYEKEEIPEEYRDNAWFAGVFPARNPQYVVVVLAENAGGGGASAAPIGGQIIHKMMEMGYVTPD